jgi:hypothetical protein
VRRQRDSWCMLATGRVGQGKRRSWGSNGVYAKGVQRWLCAWRNVCGWLRLASSEEAGMTRVTHAGQGEPGQRPPSGEGMARGGRMWRMRTIWCGGCGSLLRRGGGGIMGEVGVWWTGASGVGASRGTPRASRRDGRGHRAEAW